MVGPHGAPVDGQSVPRRGALRLLATAAALGLLAACGATPGVIATPTPLATATPIAMPTPSARVGELGLLLWESGAEAPTLAAVQGGYRAANPRVKLTTAVSEGGAPYYDRLQTLAAAGTPPDVARLEPLWLPYLAAKGLLAPLEHDIAAERFPTADFWPALVAACRWQGALHALPERATPLTLLVNPARFAAASVPDANAADATRQWTWPTMLSAAQRLTGGSGPSRQYGFAFDAGIADLLPWLWADGGHMFTDDAKPTSLDLANANSVQAVQWLADMATRFHVAPTPAELGGATYLSLFGQGKLAMYATTADVATVLRATKGNSWDLAPLPVGAAGRFNVAGGAAYAAAAASKAPELAWSFLAYVGSPPAQQHYAAAGLGVPALQALAGPSWLGAAPPPAHRQALIAGVEEAKPLPPSPYLPPIVAEAIAPQLALLWSGNVDAQATLAAIDQKGAAILKGSLQ